MLAAYNCIDNHYNLYFNCVTVLAIVSNLLEGIVDNSFSRQRNFVILKKLLLIKSIQFNFEQVVVELVKRSAKTNFKS